MLYAVMNWTKKKITTKWQNIQEIACFNNFVARKSETITLKVKANNNKSDFLIFQSIHPNHLAHHLTTTGVVKKLKINNNEINTLFSVILLWQLVFQIWTENSWDSFDHLVIFQSSICVMTELSFEKSTFFIWQEISWKGGGESTYPYTWVEGVHVLLWCSSSLAPMPLPRSPWSTTSPSFSSHALHFPTLSAPPPPYLADILGEIHSHRFWQICHFFVVLSTTF